METFLIARFLAFVEKVLDILPLIIIILLNFGKGKRPGKRLKN